MGVKDLWTLLAPALRPVTLAELRGQTLAVDLSIWIVETQGVRQMQGVVIKPHLRNLFFRVNHLLQLGVNLIFVIEGEAPELKWETMAQRNQTRYRGAGRGRGGRGTAAAAVTRKPKRSHFKAIVKECCQLLDALGVPFVQAAGEAEAKCAFLNAHGIVDGCITDDGDVFLYGARRVYRNFNMKDSHIESYDMEDIETKLNLDRLRMVALGLLLGCDYVPHGVPGVGREMALKFFKLLTQGENVLKRFESWMKNKDHFAQLEAMSSAKKPAHCNQCKHPGSAREHEKQGCALCSSWQSCEPQAYDYQCPCNWHQRQQQLSAAAGELNIQKRAVQTKGFPWPKVVEEFMNSRDKLPRQELQWKCPNLLSFIGLCEVKLEWVEDYSREKLVPLLTLWGMRAKVGIYSDRSSRTLEPHSIVKTRVRQGVPCYEIQWFKLDEDTKFIGEYYTTIEEADLFSQCYSDVVKLYNTSKPAKASRKSVKAKAKSCDKENTDMDNIAAAMDNVEISSTRSCIKDGGASTNHRKTVSRKKASVLKAVDNVEAQEEDLSKATFTHLKAFSENKSIQKQHTTIDLHAVSEELRTLDLTPKSSNTNFSQPLPTCERMETHSQIKVAKEHKSVKSESSSEEEEVEYLPLSQRLALLPKVNKTQEPTKGFSVETSVYKVNNKGGLDSKVGLCTSENLCKIERAEVSALVETMCTNENAVTNHKQIQAASKAKEGSQVVDLTDDYPSPSEIALEFEQQQTSEVQNNNSKGQFFDFSVLVTDNSLLKYSQALDEGTLRTGQGLGIGGLETIPAGTSSKSAVIQSLNSEEQIIDTAAACKADNTDDDNLVVSSKTLHTAMMQSGHQPGVLQPHQQTETSIKLPTSPENTRLPNTELDVCKIISNQAVNCDREPGAQETNLPSKLASQKEIHEADREKAMRATTNTKKGKTCLKAKKTGKVKGKKTNKPWYSDSIFDFSADDDLLLEIPKGALIDNPCAPIRVDSNTDVPEFQTRILQCDSSPSVSSGSYTTMCRDTQITINEEEASEAFGTNDKKEHIEEESPPCEETLKAAECEPILECSSHLASQTHAGYVSSLSEEALYSTELGNQGLLADTNYSLLEGGFIRDDSLSVSHESRNRVLSQCGFLAEKCSPSGIPRTLRDGISISNTVSPLQSIDDRLQCLSQNIVTGVINSSLLELSVAETMEISVNDSLSLFEDSDIITTHDTVDQEESDDVEEGESSDVGEGQTGFDVDPPTAVFDIDTPLCSPGPESFHHEKDYNRTCDALETGRETLGAITMSHDNRPAGTISDRVDRIEPETEVALCSPATVKPSLSHCTPEASLRRPNQFDGPFGQPPNTTWNKSQFGNFSIGATLLNITCESEQEGNHSRMLGPSNVLYGDSPEPNSLDAQNLQAPTVESPVIPLSPLVTSELCSSPLTSHSCAMKSQHHNKLVTSSPMEISVFTAAAAASPIPLAERLLRRVDSQVLTQMSQPTRSVRTMSEPCHLYSSQQPTNIKGVMLGTKRLQSADILEFDDSDITLL